jgi:hypothetical protein
MGCDNVQLDGWLQNIAIKITASIFNDLLVWILKLPVFFACSNARLRALKI